MNEMEKLVNLLRERRGMTQEQIEAALKEFRKEAEAANLARETPKLVFNDRAASIVYPSGFVVTLDKEGTITWAYDGQKIDEVKNRPKTPIVLQNHMEACLQHIIGLHNKEKEKAEEEKYALMVMTKMYKKKAEEGRTRFVKNDTKRAFIAGMIMGEQRRIL